MHPIASLFAIALLTGCTVQVGDQSQQNMATVTSSSSVSSSSSSIDSRWVLTAGGDVMLSRYVAALIREHKDPSHPYVFVRDFLTRDDLTFVNLESPVVEGRKIPAHNTMVFRTDPDLLPALKDAGVDIVSIASNHITDQGVAGLIATRKYLDEIGLPFVGAGANEAEAYAPRIVEVKGLTIGFLAYTDPRLTIQVREAKGENGGAAIARRGRIKADVSALRPTVDLVIVSLHMGVEYQHLPDRLQRESAEVAIDAGADLVLGHHPHVLQPVELYHGKPIVWSMGNFVFDQFWSPDTQRSALLQFHFDGKRLERIEAIPLTINAQTQPTAATGSARATILSELHMPEALLTIPTTSTVEFAPILPASSASAVP